MEKVNKLLERAKEINEQAKKIREANPDLTDLWWKIEDCDLAEMRELQNGIAKLYYAESLKKMALQVNYYLGGPRYATIFAYSKEVTVKEHIVVDDVMINV